MAGERSTDETTERKLAAATLVGLRVLVPKPEEAVGWGYMLLPDRAPLDREDILDALVAMPKAVRCVALGMHGCLAIAAWPGPRSEPQYVGGSKASFEAAERSRRERQLRANPGARLLLAAEHEEPVVLSLPEFWLWRERYDIIGLSLAWSPAEETRDELVRQLGATSRIELDRPWYVSPPGASGGIGYLDGDDIDESESRPAP